MPRASLKPEDIYTDTVVLHDQQEAIESLEKIPQGGLRARLFLDRETTMRLVDEAPLQLVAAALADMDGRRATTGVLKSTLTAEVIEPEKWNRWWEPVRNALSYSPHFSYAARKPIRLRVSNLAEISSDSLDELRAAARAARKRKSSQDQVGAAAPKSGTSLSGLGGWILWIQAAEEEPMPTSVPPADFIEILKNLPASVTPIAVERLMKGVERRILDAKSPSESSIEKWQEAFAVGLDRWMELPDPIPYASIESIVALVSRILDKPGLGKFSGLVDWLGGYASKSGDDVGMISKALLSASRVATNGTERLLNRMVDSVDASSRATLWRGLIQQGLSRTPQPPLERWLSLIDLEERAAVISDLLLAVRDDDSIEGIGSILRREWRLAEPERRHNLFQPLALSWLLHERLRPDAGKTMREAIVEFGQGDPAPEGTLMSEWNDMIQSAFENEVDRVREHKNQRIGNLDNQLKDTQAELERANRQARYLQGEVQKSNHRAALEVSRDAITVLGGALQDLETSGIPLSKEAEGARVSITLALSALGAKPCGEVGEIVPFEPGLHEAHPPPAAGTLVRIMAPGVMYFKGVDSPLTIIRMQASVERRQ